jgi:hypothetical protein
MIIEQLLALIEDLTFAPLSKTAFANIKSQTRLHPILALANENQEMTI